MSTAAFDTSARYSVAGQGGIAFRIVGPEQVWEPYQYYVEDEDGNEFLVDDNEGEWVDGDTGRVVAIMVGDDREHLVDINDLTPIDDEDYCSGCGQIGCGWGS